MKEKRWSIGKVLSLAVILLCMAGHFYLVWHGSAGLPQSVEISGEEEIRLDGMQLQTLEKSDRYSFSMKKILEVESILTEGDFEGKEYPDRRLAVEGWYTDSGYGKCCGLDLADGAYFQVDPAGEFSQTVVISDQLARKLFYRVEAAGEVLQIDGKNYKICGVYRKDTSLPARLSEDRFERIYLPYPAYPKLEDGSSPVSFFYDREAGEAHFPEKAVGELEEALETELPVMQTVDLKECGELIWQTFRLAVFFAGLLLEIGLFTKVWNRIFSKKQQFYGEKAGLLSVGYLAGLLVLMAVIGMLILFPLVIPSQYLPRENIFQISWYLDALAKSRQSENSRMIYSMYQGLGNRTLWLGVGFLAVEVMGCLQAAFLWNGRRKK